MKPGNLVRVRFTSTGDNPWVVKLFRKRTPVLLVKLNGKWATILDIDGKQKTLGWSALNVVS
jgi:hypothetical protein